METTSANYKTDIEKKLRNFSYIKIIINMADPTTADTNTTVDNDHAYFSDVTTTDKALNTSNTYATMEHNRLVLDGTQVCPPEIGDPIDLYQGYVSSSISDASGSFPISPKITTTFPSLVHFAALSFAFDVATECYPSDLQIISYNGVTVVEDITCHPTSSKFITPLGVPSSGYCDKIEVIFKTMVTPHRRARMAYMVFGLMKEWTDSTITTSTLKRETDLLNSVLPVHTLEFTSIDVNKEYNLDNPTGMWQYIEQLQPITILYGYQLDSGIVEWVTGGHIFTNGEMTSESSGALSTITFFGESLLEQLKTTYYKGVYSVAPVSLYTLAQNVLTFANLPALSDGSSAYYIDPSLSTIMTSCPLPEKQVNELLQLIANAGRCVLYTDRDGRINIRHIDETLVDFTLDFDNMKTIPKVNKIPALLSVSTSYVSLKVEATTSSMIRSDFSLTTNTQYTLAYGSEAVGSSYTVTGTLVVVGAPVYYAHSCVITLNGIGTLEVLGYKINRSEIPTKLMVGAVGYDCPMANELINNLADATAYASWVSSILSRSNEYALTDRGYPELDTLDTINVQTLFSASIEATVVKHKLMYNGALSAETTVLSK